MNNKILGGFAILLVLAGLIGAGCSDDDPATPAAGTGRLVVDLIDAPGDFEQVNVVIVEINVHRTADDSLSGWYTVSDDTTRVDLLQLSNGASVSLADSTLPAGDFDQIRLVLGEGNHVYVDGDSLALTVPSGSQSGVKIHHDFSLGDGEVYALALDFDAERSIHQTGNGTYIMRPVIRAQAQATAGAIAGVVDPAAARAQVWTVAGDDTVTAWADTLSGAFRLMMLPAGTYDVSIEPSAGAWSDTLVTDVTVSTGLVTDLGTVVLSED